MEAPNAPNLTWRLDLAISNQRIGDILLERKEYARALEEYRVYRKGAQDAANRDPEQGEWQRFLANSHLKIGDALLAQGTVGETLAEYAMALQVYAQLAVKDLRPRSQRNLAIAHQRLGAARLAMNDLPGALAEFRACLSIPVDESCARCPDHGPGSGSQGLPEPTRANPRWRRLCRRASVTICSNDLRRVHVELPRIYRETKTPHPIPLPMGEGAGRRLWRDRDSTSPRSALASAFVRRISRKEDRG